MVRQEANHTVTAAVPLSWFTSLPAMKMLARVWATSLTVTVSSESRESEVWERRGESLEPSDPLFPSAASPCSVAANLAGPESIRGDPTSSYQTLTRRSLARSPDQMNPSSTASNDISCERGFVNPESTPQAETLKSQDNKPSFKTQPKLVFNRSQPHFQICSSSAGLRGTKRPLKLRLILF